MEELLKFLETHTIYKTNARGNIVPKEQRCQSTGTDDRMRFWHSKDSLRSYTVSSGPYFDQCVKVLPESWKQVCNAVTINKDLVCAPHRDKYNRSRSLILFLGDFTGGELHLDTGETFSERGVFHEFDGAQHVHWNSPIKSGTKYAVVYYGSAS
jgi:hypothetical protein